MKNIDEYGFNKEWIKSDVQSAVYRQMVKKDRLRQDENEYVLSHTVADADFCARLVAALMKYLEAKERVLSVAEGQGHLVRALMAQGLTAIYGVDICRELVELGQARGIALQQADARSLPFKDNTFDQLIINEAIGALGLSDALLEARRVLKPGGRIIITNYNYAEHNAQDVSSSIVKYRYVLPGLIIKALRDKNFQQMTSESILINNEEEGPADRMDIITGLKRLTCH